MTSPADHAATVRDMCFRCHSAKSPETRQIKHGVEWCNVCWDRKQEAPREVVALADRATELEQDEHFVRAEALQAELGSMEDRAEAAEARATELEREAEQLRANLVLADAAADAAEARAAALERRARAALREAAPHDGLTADPSSCCANHEHRKGSA